jgi:hypothetical protein
VVLRVHDIPAATGLGLVARFVHRGAALPREREQASGMGGVPDPALGSVLKHLDWEHDERILNAESVGAHN